MLQLGVIGVAIVRFLLEIVNVVVLVYGWKKYGMKRSFLQGEGFKEVFMVRAFWDYVKFVSRVALGGYNEYLGIELRTILCGMYGDVNIVAAWVSVRSVMVINYTYGLGFSNSLRTYVGKLIGKQEFFAAKKIGGWAMLLCFTTVLVPWGLV